LNARRNPSNSRRCENPESKKGKKNKRGKKNFLPFLPFLPLLLLSSGYLHRASLFSQLIRPAILCARAACAADGRGQLGSGDEEVSGKGKEQP
jgi:hypothetical protein